MYAGCSLYLIIILKCVAGLEVEDPDNEAAP